MPPKPARKAESAVRVASGGGKHLDASITVPKKVQIWPEWSETDINAEKWEVAHKPGKDKDKAGKSPVVQQFFEDPEGKLELPSSLRVTHWKRPSEFILEKVPTIVDTEEGQEGFDLFTKNEACSESELIRYIISEVTALWKATEVKAPVEPSGSGDGSPNAAPPGSVPEEYVHEWKPWEHIYALSKVGKGGPNVPVYNPYGKYVVRLWWMGCWRKIVVDDLVPFDEEDRMLLPSTCLQSEIWPMILSKALIRIASIEYSGGNTACEFGDFSVIHCLMGWIPEVIQLQYRSLEDVWNILTKTLPNFKLPEPPQPEKEKADTPVKPDSAGESGMGPLDEADIASQAKEKDKPAKSEKADSKLGKVKDKGGKESKAAKDKTPQSFSKPVDEVACPETPEAVVFASFSGAPRLPARTLALSEVSETSERLRQNSISYLYPHPVWVKQSRNCPLERPPPPEVIPKWKTIRPRKPKEVPSAEPKTAQAEPEPPIRTLELCSPFINYKVSPVPISVNDFRPRSSGVMERGGTRPGTSLAGESIDEGEEEGREISQTKSVKEVAYASLQGNEKGHSGSIHGGISSAKSSVNVKSKPGKQKKEEHTKPQKGVEPAKKGERNDSARTAKSEKTPKGFMSSAPVASTEGDGVVPVIPPAEEGGFSEVPPPEDTTPTDFEPKMRDMWMDFDAFSHCFKHLVIYHKPHTYPSRKIQPAELKNFERFANKPAAAPIREEKTNHVLYNDGPPQYLFVDSVKQSEIIVSLTGLSHWPDPVPVPPPAVTPAAIPTGSSKGAMTVKTPDLKTESAAATEPPASAGPSAVSEVEPVKERVTLVPGSLIAEPHSWKSVSIQKPVLRIKTTATKAAALILPPGRHVLKFTVSAPLAHQLTLCSSTKFQFGSEEDIMPCLTAESCRFVEYATETINRLGRVMQSFGDPVTLSQAMDQFVRWHCPYMSDSAMSKTHHFKIFNESLYAMMKKALPTELLTSDTSFSLRCLLFDVTTPNILGTPSASRPATALSTNNRGSAKGGKGGKSRTTVEAEKPIPDGWADREPTVDELIAQVKLSKSWRAYYVRKVVTARSPGTPANARVCEILSRVWACLEPAESAATNGLNVYKNLFKADGSIMERYPFHADEWSKILYSDYPGSYPEQSAGSWFIVFREIFYVHEPTFCVPKLYTPGLPNCLLRVVDNDTGIEIPKVFQRVAPYLYPRNKLGYTFVAEGRAPPEKTVLPGKVTLRLIGSHTPLPTPARSEVVTSFSAKEIQDYYVPHDSKVILRYNIRVLEESHLTSIQLQTSRPDVYVKLQVLDRGEEIVEAEGKGHVVLPAVIFQSDVPAGGAVETRERRPSSRGSGRGGSKSAKKKDKEKEKASTTLEATSGSPLPPATAAADIDDLPSQPPHKYTIQALVKRDSWPLNQVQWSFARELKEQEKNELKVQKKESDPTTPKDKAGGGIAPTAGGGNPGKGGKGKGKDSKSGGKEKSSRPASVQFDITKPHWLLRVVSDGPAQDEIEITKDAERADEIRAAKRAWEEADPGRAAKAYQSRLKYLNSHLVKNPEAPPSAGVVSAGGEGEEIDRASPEFEDSDLIYTLEAPPPRPSKDILPPLDVTPFLRKLCDYPRYFDEQEQRRQQEVRTAEFGEYNRFRERVEQWREDNVKERNRQKVAQIELFEKMQAMVDEGRATLNAPRDAFRNKYLDAERMRLEALATHEASQKVHTEKVASPKGRKSAKGKSAKKK